MAEKITTLYIDGCSLRLAVSRGKKILEWVSSPLDKDLISNNQVNDEPGLASKIQSLLKEYKIHNGSVQVVLSGLHCISRPMTLPKLPSDMLDEAVKRESRRLLPVSLEQLYLTWQKIPSSDERIQIFVVAAPIATVDSVVNTLHRAGLKPTFVGIKPVLLAWLAKESDSIIIDVQTGEFDIVIKKHGVPQTIRTVAFASEHLSPERKIKTVINELTRTISFYNTNNVEDQLSPEMPVIVSGQLSEGIGFFESFSSMAEYPSLPLQFELDYPEGFSPDVYSANMGLVRYNLQKKNKDNSSFNVQNSLPARYLPKPVSPVNIFGIPAAVLAILLIAFLIINNLNTSAKIESNLAKVDSAMQTLQEGLSQRQQISEEIEEMKADISQAEQSRDNYNVVLDYMLNMSSRVKKGLTQVVYWLPNSMTLESISYTGNTMMVGARAQSQKDVLQYIVDLEESGLFGEIIITNMKINEDLSHSFILMINTSDLIGETSGIDVILAYFPNDVSLISLGQDDGGTTTINANAPDEESIVIFMQALEMSGLFQDIALQSQVSNENGSIDFVFTVRRLE